MNLPSHLIDRTSYIDRIKPFMRKDIAKVLTGQRRVGKSFLLYQLVKLIMTEEPGPTSYTSTWKISLSTR